MRIIDIVMKGNEHRQLQADTIYAKLVDDEDKIVIVATLNYILGVIRDRNYQVDNVEVSYKERSGKLCSEVRLNI